MLRLDSVSASYGSSTVLHDVTLEVRAGEVVALLGANGAGKTTLLRAISGLLRPVSGSIWLGESRIDRLASHRIIGLGVAHCPEGRRLFSSMTIRENLLLGAASKSARAAANTTLQQMFDLFPVLAQRQRQRADLLSGGEQQQCAIARALMNQPRLLLLDEPSLGLAPQLIAEVFRTISVVKHSGVTVLLVEQNAHQSLAVADRAYVLERGQIVLSGPAAELAKDEKVKLAYLGKKAG